MSNLALTSRSALGATLEDSRSSVSLELVEDQTVAHVAARKGQLGALTAAFQQHYGITLPATPAVVTGPSIVAVWAGPEQWLIFASSHDGRDLEPELRNKLGATASVADQTDARMCVRIAGPSSRAVLAKLLPIDIHPRTFPAGAVALTHAAHIGVLVWRSDKPRTNDCFKLACARSYARSLWHALIESGAEFGLSVSG